MFKAVTNRSIGSASAGLGQDVTEYDIQLSKYVKVGNVASISYYSFSISSVRYSYNYKNYYKFDKYSILQSYWHLLAVLSDGANVIQYKL
jgi:hypothetical protein